MEEIIVRLGSDIAEEEDVRRLYQEAGWWKEGRDDIAVIRGILNGSFCFAGAFDGERLVGMARAVSDGVSDAYIQDVVVTSSHRGRGIGGMLVQAVVRYLQERHIGWIGLVAEPGTESFYRKLGFSVMPGYQLMLNDVNS